MSCLNSLDVRRGGKAAAINKSGFMDWAIRMAGDVVRPSHTAGPASTRFLLVPTLDDLNLLGDTSSPRLESMSTAWQERLAAHRPAR